MRQYQIIIDPKRRPVEDFETRHLPALIKIYPFEVERLGDSLHLTAGVRRDEFRNLRDRVSAYFDQNGINLEYHVLKCYR